MIPCSGVNNMVLNPTYSCTVCAQELLLKSQNLMLPSFPQLMITSLLSWSNRVIWEECSVGRFLIKLPVLMSHIFMVLSRPALKRVASSWRRTIVQMKSKWPVRVLMQAELYFLVRLQTLMVRSALPEIRVWPLEVHSMAKISLMWPEKFLMFSPFSKSQILILQSALPEAKVAPSLRYFREIIDEVCPVRVFNALKGGVTLLFFEI